MPRRYTTQEFIEKANKVHKGKYLYNKAKYFNKKTDVCVTCPIHGDFWQKPYKHLMGHGCSICGGSLKLTVECFIDRANLIHHNKYDYSQVEYKNNRTKVCIVCPIHGKFYQIPDSHLRGCGCSKCKNERASKRLSYDLDAFIQKANSIHNNLYDYSKVNYIDSKTKVCIICPKHGEFKQKPNDHLRGHGCLKCKLSNMEKEIEILLDENNIKYEREKRFNWLIDKGEMRLDFYLPEYNVAIECQGGQHYKPIDFFGGVEEFNERVKRDKLKFNLCSENGVKLFYYAHSKHNDNIITDKNKLISLIYECTY